MRISAAQRVQNENRIRAAMDRLLRGETPAGGGCDIKTLAAQAGVDRTAFYGNRPYAHLRAEFERRLQQLHQAGETPDPKTAQITRLKAEIDTLRSRVTQADSTIEELRNFRAQALSRIAAQHEEIQRLRTAADANTNITRLPSARQKTIGPC
jgi:chromosome segregation ATPase